MKRALVTFAVGDHQRLLEIALPRFREYGAAHDYTLLTPSLDQDCDRPPSWWKVPMLRRALAEYGEVLWLDCDVVITAKGLEENIADRISSDAWQGLVEHHTPDGDVPNLGVWFLRRPMIPFLEMLWGMTKYVHHPWWEQAAMLDLLGYEHEPRPSRHVTDTNLWGLTCWLSLEWNSHEQNDRDPDPRFAHVTPNTVDWRLPIMQDYVANRLPATMPADFALSERHG